jgi:DNA-binding SARP family transcriptional activator
MQPSGAGPSASNVGAATLWVSLLGPPNLEWAGAPLPIARRQVRALLYRLAAESQPVPREHLCFLFWPDTPESSARRNLTGLLSHLRRTLPTSEMLVTEKEQVWLDFHYVWSDVEVFQRLFAIEERFGRIEALEQAVGLYRGPFLDGFSLPDSSEFEMWCTAERQTWERLYLEALASLIEEQAAKGEYAAAIAFAQRYLATDDLAEEIHRRLIELYAISGDRSAALRQYEQCLTILERELGVDPLPETQSAYRAVLDGSPSAGTAPAAQPTWTTLPGLDVPLIGRDDALGRLARAFARARAGRGGVVLISGEAGIGKSRLMQEFATRQQGQALVLAGGGYADAQTIPYQPVVEALRPALGIQPMSPNVQPAWLAEASRLMPGLRDLYPSLPAPLPGGPEQARARLFEALCQLTRGLARRLQACAPVSGRSPLGRRHDPGLAGSSGA